MLRSQLSWIRSQHPPTQWNLRGGRKGSTYIKKSKKSPSLILAVIDCNSRQEMDELMLVFALNFLPCVLFLEEKYILLGPNLISCWAFPKR
jgi:hypothetical protein